MTGTEPPASTPATAAAAGQTGDPTGPANQLPTIDEGDMEGVEHPSHSAAPTQLGDVGQGHSFEHSENRQRQSWERISNSIIAPGDSNMSIGGASCMIPGLANATPAQLDTIRKALGHFEYLTHIIYNMLAHGTSSKMQQLVNGVHQSLSFRKVTAAELPGVELSWVNSKPLSLKAMASPDGSGYRFNPCLKEWTSHPGMARNLLSPAHLVTMNWIGDKYCPELFALAYSFMTDEQEFANALVASPVNFNNADWKWVPDDADHRRTKANINSAGAALFDMTKVIDRKLYDLVRAVHNVCHERGFALGAASTPYPSFNLADLTKTDMRQYLDCSTAVSAQVQSALPTLSSLPSTEAQFVDDQSSTWFRSAEYTFMNIKMPVLRANAGLAMSQLIWHRYASDVLHARENCMNLSEKQVIQHLFSRINRADAVHTVAQAAALQRNITVRKWLDAIRDFYFTNGQFRYHIETAWQRYNAAEAQDFNDFIHHIKTYWQLIFLDYVSMEGKQSKIDFACILFAKLQALRADAQKCPLGNTLFMYMSATTLVEKFTTQLQPATRETDQHTDLVATEFISWVLGQLMQAREAANAVQRYSGFAHANLDFAKVAFQQPLSRVTPDRDTAPAAATAETPYIAGRRTARRQYQPQFQRQAAISQTIPISDINSNMQTSSDSRMKLEGLADALKYPHHKFTTWAEAALEDPVIVPKFKALVKRELRGGPDTIDFALQKASNPPSWYTDRKWSVIKRLFICYVLWNEKNCIFCRSIPGKPHMCQYKNCKYLRDNVPKQVLQEGLLALHGEEDVVPVAPGSGSGNPSPSRNSSKRGRYDSSSRNKKFKRANYNTQVT